MKKVYIAVMDYSDGTIKMYSVELKDGWQCEDIEKYLKENTDYKKDLCYFMTGEKEIEIQY